MQIKDVKNKDIIFVYFLLIEFAKIFAIIYPIISAIPA